MGSRGPAARCSPRGRAGACRNARERSCNRIRPGPRRTRDQPRRALPERNRRRLHAQPGIVILRRCAARAERRGAQRDEVRGLLHGSWWAVGAHAIAARSDPRCCPHSRQARFRLSSRSESRQRTLGRPRSVGLALCSRFAVASSAHVLIPSPGCCCARSVGVTRCAQL
jgi:hypothetical protein